MDFSSIKFNIKKILVLVLDLQPRKYFNLTSDVCVIPYMYDSLNKQLLSFHSLPKH